MAEAIQERDVIITIRLQENQQPRDIIVLVSEEY